MNDLDENAISGEANASDMDQLTGGTYANAQDVYSASDNGTVNNAAAGTGSASPAGTLAPASNGSTYTPPSWIQSLFGTAAANQGLAGVIGQTVTQATGIINGKPVTSPAQAGATNPLGKTISLAGTNVSMGTLLAIGAVIVGALFFWKRK